MKVPKDIICLIPTWCTSTHAIGAANSLRKYYPDIPVVFMNDKFTEDQEGEWIRIYAKDVERDGYDPDPQKLIDYPNSCYIAREHIENETNGHGLAITHAMKFLHAKWIVHISTDVRIFKEGTLEYLFEDTNNTYCGTGQDWTRDGAPALGSWLFAFRGDLYHKYDMNFKADIANKCDIGAFYYNKLIEKGYKFNNHKSIMNNYTLHLSGGRKANPEQWDKYF